MNLFKMLGNLGNLAKVQQEVQAITEELAKVEYEGKAGGDMVTARVSGAQQVLGISIDPKLIADNDRELIEDLVVAAVNDALVLAKKQTSEQMQKKLSDKLNLPDLSGMLGQMMPKM